jgi:hypothetical protein
VPVIIELVALGLDFPMSPFGKRHVDTPVVKVIVEQGLDGGWGLPKTFFGGEKNLSEAAYDFIMGFSLFRARPLFKQLGAYSLGLLKPDRPDGAVSRVLVCAYLVLGASGVGEKLAWVELEGLPGRARLKVPAGMRLDRYFSQRAGTDQVKAEPLGPALESALVTLGRQVGERAGMREILSMLLPGKFTLGQAKATIETLSGQKINEVSFRRHMSQKTVYTGEELKSKQFRPPKFYRFKD